MSIDPRFKGNKAQAKYIQSEVNSADKSTLESIISHIRDGEKSGALYTLSCYRRYCAAQAVDLGDSKR